MGQAAHLGAWTVLLGALSECGLRRSFVFALAVGVGALGHRGPRMPVARSPDRDARRRERGIGEIADPHRDQLRIGLVPDGRAAVGAEVERPLLALVVRADIVRVPALYLHLLLRVARLHRERAAGLPLAGEAVAHRDPYGLSLHSDAELSTAAG